MFATFLIVLIVVICNFSLIADAQKKVNPAVTELNVPQYLGLWYQMYDDAVVEDSFETGDYCTTALYGDNGDGTLSVHNFDRLNAPNGQPNIIDGYAYIPDPSAPGKLKVSLDVSEGAVPFDAPYWVLGLGPINALNQYDWAIVSDNLSFFLFVLARDPQVFKTKYETEVLSILASMGFQNATAPIKTYQEPDCQYESAIRLQHIKENAQREANAGIKN